MAKYCSECGKPIDDDARFCPECGTPAQAPSPAPAPEAPRPASPAPGAFQPGAQAPQAEAPSQPQGPPKFNWKDIKVTATPTIKFLDKKKLIWIGIAIVALILIRLISG